MNEEQNVPGVDIGNIPVHQESSDETPDKEAEETNEGDNGEEGEPETSAEENKVSYSRFSNVNQRRKEAERRAWELEERLAELEQRKPERSESKSDEPPAEWFEVAGGDTPQSRKAWNVLRNSFNPSQAEIERMAAESWQQAQVAEERRIASNEQNIDDELEDISISVGRDLTDNEQLALLEIMDEYSVKDENDRILRLFPAEKAWEIYEMESGAKRAPRTQARDRVASLTSSRSEGEPSATGRNNAKTFDPSWGAWEAQVNKIK